MPKIDNAYHYAVVQVRTNSIYSYKQQTAINASEKYV
jgi:hypothetical protein